MANTSFQTDIAAGERFEFGKNWNRFLTTLTEQKIARAVGDLQKMVGINDWTGLSFLDIGSGSGLSSLAAHRLGASVHSFDYDPHSVATTRALRDRHSSGSAHWTIEEGSALDRNYLAAIGKFDIVNSWGVLHHTGNMWTGLENALIPVKDGGTLFVAIYNDQFPWTAVHTFLKRSYNRGSFIRKWPILCIYAATSLTYGFVADVLQLRNPLRRYSATDRLRGMNWWHDIVDWAGGYPFETARPEEILNFFTERGCQLWRLKTCGGRQGCNEFVFDKVPLQRVSDAGGASAGLTLGPYVLRQAA